MICHTLSSECTHIHHMSLLGVEGVELVLQTRWVWVNPALQTWKCRFLRDRQHEWLLSCKYQNGLDNDLISALHETPSYTSPIHIFSGENIKQQLQPCETKYVSEVHVSLELGYVLWRLRFGVAIIKS